MALDIFLLLIVVGGFIHGYRRGLIRAIFSFIGIFFGILFASKFGHVIADFLSSRGILQSNYLPFTGFSIAFIALLVFLSIVSRLVEKMADAMLLGVANKLVGGLLEVAILALILSTFIWYLNGLGVITHEMTADSKSYPYLVKLPPAMFSFVSGFLPFFDMLSKSASGDAL